MHHFTSRFVFVVIALCLFCQCKNEPEWHAVEGKTMGGLYHIQYFGIENYDDEIESLLEEINQSVSTYDPSSTISKFNETGSLSIPLAENGEPKNVLHGHFFANLEEAYEVYKASLGYFDPTVGPLVDFWGFGPAPKPAKYPDSTQVAAIQQKTGMDKVEVRPKSDTIYIRVTEPGVRLDFSAIAQGYATDMVFELLKQHGVQDQFVEITGEVRTAGKSPRGDDWVVGINVPEETASLEDIAARVRLRTYSMATSGNYRNHFELEGKKIVHTINPMTGYPEENDLLSATILHPRCMTADALATAAMAMGADNTIRMLEKVQGAKGYLIYRDKAGKIATFTSPGLSKDLLTE